MARELKTYTVDWSRKIHFEATVKAIDKMDAAAKVRRGEIEPKKSRVYDRPIVRSIVTVRK